MTTNTAYEELEKKLDQLRHGDHLCFIYGTEDEHRAFFSSFMRQGLERNEKVTYIIDAHPAEEVLNYLRDDGVEIEPYLNSGQLTILAIDEVYMRKGVFDPDDMIELLNDATNCALDNGYSALRVTGEMTWTLRGLTGSERLIECEAKLNDFFPGSKCLAVCQYDRRRFESALLLDVLATHTIVVIGTEVYDNFYYVPPKDFLTPDMEVTKFNNRLNTFVKQRQSEKDLQKSEAKYRSLYENMLNGFAYCKILLDENSQPIDFVYLEVNDSFEKLTGLRKEDFVGKKVTEAIPAIKDAHPELLDIYGKVALTGKETQFEIYIEPLEKWFSTSVYSPQKGYFIAVFDNITKRKQAEKELEMKDRNLEEVNSALRVLLQKIEEDKTKIEESMLSNVKELVEPYLEKLKESGLNAVQIDYASVLESNLNDIISPFSSRLSSKLLNLSPTEIRVANLVKQGRDTKAIAGLMNLSSKTIATHRRNIRKKLGIRDKKTNLRTHLLSIQE